jgi:nitrite reductase/ring-hydroxylating ferredoxin subunit/Fe-S cluster biogenesis protein NfuA
VTVIESIMPGRNDIARLVGDIERLEMIFEGWDDTPRGAAKAYGLAIEALNGEALRRLIAALKHDPAALAAMKLAAADEVVYAVLRRHGIVKPSLTERVEAALESIRPMLASHGGDVELVSVAPPSIEVRFTGSCDGCPASQLTFHAGVKKAVEEACPEITEILQVKGTAAAGANGESVRFVSPFALGSGGRWHVAAKLHEIPEGGVKAQLLEGEKILLSRRGSIVTCFQNACAHLGLALDGGDVEDGIITCPFHNFRYDLASGECLTAPAVQLQPHAVRVIGNRVEVRLEK